MPGSIYVESSALLRSSLEDDRGLREVIEKADVLVASRLTLFEAFRTIARAKALEICPPAILARAERDASGEFGGPEPGHVAWQELMTTDAEIAKRFYTSLFDYATEPMPMGDSGQTYPLFKTTDPEKPTEAGMMQITPDMGPMPSSWGLYFSVASADETAKKAQELGGKVVDPPTDIPNVGRFAILRIRKVPSSASCKVSSSAVGFQGHRVSRCP